MQANRFAVKYNGLLANFFYGIAPLGEPISQQTLAKLSSQPIGMLLFQTSPELGVVEFSRPKDNPNPHFSRKMRPKGRNRRSGLCQSGSSGLTPLITEKANCFLGDGILGRAELALQAGSE